MQEIEENARKAAITKETGDDDDSMDVDVIEGPQAETPAPTAPQDFEKSRQELLQLVRSALNESALSLDFVSLLMSSLRPQVAATSQSPLLKQMVPQGSLSADSLHTRIPEEDHLVGAGWKLQALDTASSQLEVAAKRLTSEAYKEEVYWNRILDTVSHGEVLFKIRNGDNRGLGVKYGYADSGSEYPDRGIAIVKRGPDGIPAYKFEVPRTRNAVRVTLYDTSSGDRVRVGSSAQIELLPDEAANAEIRNSRTLLFEEELFFEMVKEARQLASHRITVDNNRITCTLFDEVLEIEYAELQATEQDDNNNNSDANDNVDTEQDKTEKSAGGAVSTRADCIATTFRLLLCYAHRRRLEKRRELPAPLSSKSTPPSTRLFILRPLLAHLQHNKIVKRTRRLLEMILADQNGSELSVAPDVLGEEQSPPLGRLMYPPRSTFTVKVTSPHPMAITVKTSSPLQSHIPLYEATAVEVPGEASKSRASFYELTELEDWLHWILKRKA